MLTIGYYLSHHTVQRVLWDSRDTHGRMPSIEGVNRVDPTGRYRIPKPLGDAVAGKHLAAFRNDRGNIELKPVEPDHAD